MEDSRSRIESELEIKAYIQNIKYAIDHGARITFQAKRILDENRDKKYTNQYTVNALFPDENPVDVLKRELKSLTVAEYMRTVKDLRFSERAEMREFGKVYNDTDDVYIKIRVEALNVEGNSVVFVMSFHFAEKAFTLDMFPYKTK